MTWSTLLILGIGAGAALIGVAYRHYSGRDLPDLSDPDFLKLFLDRRLISSVDALKWRRYIADQLGVPVQKLSPEQSIAELSRRFDYLGDFRVAWSDLMDQMAEARAKRNLGPLRQEPKTIGQLIEELARSENEEL